MFSLQNFNSKSFSYFSKLLTASMFLMGPPFVLASENASEREHAVTLAACQHNAIALNTMAEQYTGYVQGYALYRLAAFDFGAGDTVKARERLTKAEAQLGDISSPEADALRAGVIAMSLGLDPQMSSQKGPLVIQLIQHSLQDSGAKPRALLINGINLFYTPPAYGGGAEKSKAELELAIEAFNAQNKDADVSWGLMDAHIWLGQALVQLGDKAAAIKHFEKAAELEPNCTWAQYWLSTL